MRVLHDYNYSELADSLYDIFHDLQVYEVLVELLNSKSRSEGVVCLANDLLHSFSQDMEDFDKTFDRITRSAVPSEGREKFGVCFYPLEEQKKAQ